MESLSRRQFVKTVAAASTIACAGGATTIAELIAGSSRGGAYRSQWHRMPDRYWTGPATWANPWEDWQIQEGKLVCTKTGKGNRTVHCLTHQLNDGAGSAEIAVTIQYCGSKTTDETGRGLVHQATQAGHDEALGSAGLALGVRVKDPIDDYRSRLLFGAGLNIGLTGAGELVIDRDHRKQSPQAARALAAGEPVRLVCRVRPESGQRTYSLKLEALNPDDDAVYAVVTAGGIAPETLVGNVAVVNNLPPKVVETAPAGLYAFSDWTIAGSKITASPDQAFGPILWTLYTLSNRVMKMTAQMPPVGEADNDTVELQIQSARGWTTVATAQIDPLACTATFRAPDWDDSRDIHYRVCWTQKYIDGAAEQHTYAGVVRKDPKDKPEIVVGGYCCFVDYLFPNAAIAEQTRKADPDILFFTGDQIYEGVGGFGIIRQGDIKRMVVNYLRKVALVGWSFRDVTRDRPTVWMPDDHDVYHGNLWGAEGRKVTLEEWSSRTDYQNSACVGNMGGYVQPAEFVIAVERTQTAHLPDPYDPTPVGQGIGVYYTALNYGRVSFAILEDRKFKSGPMSVFQHQSHRADWITDRASARAADVPAAKLLGDRQLAFLRDWITDWRDSDMKMTVSQTVLCNAATHHGGPNHFLVADMDSNGWPQSGRNRALDIVRRGYALMLGGDQHLPTVIQHGIESHHDAGFSFCVPAGATGYQRWWRPEEIEAMTRTGPRHGDRANTGEYLDGFGNRIDVWAAANPPAKRTAKTRLETGRQKSAGFGIVRVNKKEGAFVLEAWPVGAEVTTDGAGEMYPGWPMKVSAGDCAGAANPTLPAVMLRRWGREAWPVVQVCDAEGQVVSVARMTSSRFSPRVFEADADYTVKVIWPEAPTEAERVLMTFENVRPGQSRRLVVRPRR